MKDHSDRPAIHNRKALHDYHIIERLECGIVLTGTEVKAVRAGLLNFKDSYARIINGELFLLNCHISPYEYGGYANHEAERDRKLLVHQAQIRRLNRQVETKGITLIPLKMYFNEKGIIKIELGLGKGKQLADKRSAIAERDARRELDRTRKGH